MTRNPPAGRNLPHPGHPSTPQNPPTPPTPPRTVSVGSPAAVLAVVPHLLGFIPASSLIVLGAGPPQGRVHVTLRFDLPDPPAAAAASTIAQHAVAVLTSQRQAMAVVIGYGPGHLVTPVIDLSGRRRSRPAWNCGTPCASRTAATGPTCAASPPAARPRACASTRPIRRPRPWPRLACRYCRTGLPWLPRSPRSAGSPASPCGRRPAGGQPRPGPAQPRGPLGPPAPTRARLVRLEGLSAVADPSRLPGRRQVRHRRPGCVAVAGPGPAGCPGRRLGPDGPRFPRRPHRGSGPTSCAGPSPPTSPAPAALLAFTAWQCGNGALANVALDRALDADPGYSMALLLRDTIDAGAPPSLARLPMTPEEVAASYAADDERPLRRPPSPRHMTARPSTVLNGRARQDKLRELFVGCCGLRPGMHWVAGPPWYRRKEGA